MHKRKVDPPRSRTKTRPYVCDSGTGVRVDNMVTFDSRRCRISASRRPMRVSMSGTCHWKLGWSGMLLISSAPGAHGVGLKPIIGKEI
ncbi:hypothetical protein OGATHE_004341 [Ogataea polymorpha]|uniref:Uncharacterized protein n=1 Tax=Ogataea polymorpha TaxID=460523 RepID=A0A9P8T2A6_9ASCO|nr:hypothetical protein OGATHE_004341 [Ogataea polymorpha]